MEEIENYILEVLDLAFKKSDFDQIIFDLTVLSDKINYSTVTDTESDGDGQKRELICAALNDISSEALTEYFQTLIDNDNLWLFDPSRFRLFVDGMNEIAKDSLHLDLTTAVPIRTSDIKRIASKLTEKMERKVLIDTKVDESVVGGAVIKKGNYIFDYSIRRKLDNFGQEWKTAIRKAMEANA